MDCSSGMDCWSWLDCCSGLARSWRLELVGHMVAAYEESRDASLQPEQATQFWLERDSGGIIQSKRYKQSMLAVDKQDAASFSARLTPSGS